MSSQGGLPGGKRSAKPQSEASVGVRGEEKKKEQKQIGCFEYFRNCVIIFMILGQTFSTSVDFLLVENTV